MFQRTMTKRLAQWKARPREQRKALCLIGARQIGKTTLVRDFAQRNYRAFAEINFLTNPEASRIFAGSLAADTLITNLTAYLHQSLTPGETLVFFDEIQDFPQIRTAIKPLVEDGRFDYIESGSLLGVRHREVKSYPVGFEEIWRMYPMDFREFLLAQNVPPETLDYLQDCFETGQPVTDSVHHTMMQLFNLYLVVGGMPEVVQTYVDTQDISLVVSQQRNLLEQYRLDIAKYAVGTDRPKIREIFDAIPTQLNAKNRRFMVNSLGKNARMNRYANSFLWLSEAGVALPSYNVTVPQHPLKLNEQRSLFRLFMNDPGLLSAASFDNIQLDLLQGKLNVNLGTVVENAVACQLKANGFDLCYFDSKRYGEVDFVLPQGREIDLLEVKSGNDWKAHAALNNLLNISEWRFRHAWVACKGNLVPGEKLAYLPLYMAMFLRPAEIPSGSRYQVDISSLPGGSQLPT